MTNFGVEYSLTLGGYTNLTHLKETPNTNGLYILNLVFIIYMIVFY